MSWISISEYAKLRGVTYESVRKQLVGREEILARHIRVEGRTRYLDEWLVGWLDEHRQVRTVILENEPGQREREQEEEIKNLHVIVENLQGQIIALQGQNNNLTNELLQKERQLTTAQQLLIEEKEKPERELHTQEQQRIKDQERIIDLSERLLEREREANELRQQLTREQAEKEALQKQIREHEEADQHLEAEEGKQKDSKSVAKNEHGEASGKNQTGTELEQLGLKNPDHNSFSEDSTGIVPETTQIHTGKEQAKNRQRTGKDGDRKQSGKVLGFFQKLIRKK